MQVGEAIRSFFVDDRVLAILVVLALDFALGLTAAVARGTFRLSYIADTLRNDVLGKVFPFLVLYLGYKYAAGTDVLIPGLDLEVVMNGAWVVVVGALVGSVLGSLKDLGLFGQAPDAIAGPDPGTPGPPANPNREP